jgi:hypothetical protein
MLALSLWHTLTNSATSSAYFSISIYFSTDVRESQRLIGFFFNVFIMSEIQVQVAASPFMTAKPVYQAYFCVRLREKSSLYFFYIW